MKFQVYIKNTEGVTRTLNWTSGEEFVNTTVKQLIEKYATVFPEDPQSLDGVRLIYMAKQLDECQTLGSYNITPHSTLCFAPRLRGGGVLSPDDEDDELPRSDFMEKLFLNM